MTLDEAIKHEEEIVEEEQYEYQECVAVHNMEGAMNCRKYAEEHRQLAEWLKDYRRLLEQQPCDDYVSRQSVIDALNKTSGIRGDALKALYDLPPVTPQPKIGRWIHREDMDYLDKNKIMHKHFMCQDCGFIHDFIDGHTSQYKYCPFCGEKMQEVEE